MTRWAVATAMKFTGKVTKRAPGEDGDPWGRPQYNGIDVQAVLSFVVADNAEEAVELAWSRDPVRSEIAEGWKVVGSSEAREAHETDYGNRILAEMEEDQRKMAALGVHMVIDRSSIPGYIPRKPRKSRKRSEPNENA